MDMVVEDGLGKDTAREKDVRVEKDYSLIML